MKSNIEQNLKYLFGVFGTPRYLQWDLISKYDGQQEVILGRGSNSIVYEIELPEYDIFQNEIVTKKYALKVLHMKGEYRLSEEQDIDRLRKNLFEFYFMGKCDHPNLLQCLGYSFDLDKKGRIVKLAFVIEKGDLDLMTMIQKSEKAERKGPNQGQIEINEKLKIALGVANGIRALHCQEKVQISHNDLKPENIMTFFKEEQEGTVVQISDFGSAQGIIPEEESKSTELVQTLRYSGPESKDRKPRKQSDIFSFGVILMQLFYGIESANQDRQYKEDFELKFQKKYQHLPLKNLIQLIDQMLFDDYKKRPTIDEVIKNLETEAISLKNCKFRNLDLEKQVQAKIVESLLQNRQFQMKSNELVNIKFLSISLQEEESIGDKGVPGLEKSLKQLINLTNLSINFCQNSLGEKGASELGNSLKQLINLKNLSIQLALNSIGDNGACSLANSIQQLKKNLTILSIDLKQNSIGERGASELGNSLKQLVHLNNLSIDLCYNSIREKGASVLAQSIKQLVNLTKLSIDLQNNAIGERGASEIGNSLKQHIKLKNLSLNLALNYIGEQGAFEIGNSIKKLISLTHLSINIQQSFIGERGSSELGNSIKQLLNLNYLSVDIRYNDGASKLENSLKQLNNLSNLIIIK